MLIIKYQRLFEYDYDFASNAVLSGTN